MEFVSKDQAYEATRKLLLDSAANWQSPRLEDVARQMSMNGDRSRDPLMYQRFLDEITADPLSPQDALDAAAEFLQNTVQPDGAQAQELIQSAKATAGDPEKGDSALWSRWLSLLESV